jgi:hypothetical protein
MTSQKIIKIVAGQGLDSALVPLWKKVGLQHQVEILVLGGDKWPDVSPIKLTIFPHVEEMPGYFRDLDQYLAGADLIVGVESSRLSTFQALRVARKMGVPFFCLTHESVPFAYESFKNIRAIQSDIYQNSDLLLPSSRRAMQLLQLEGVAESKIKRLAPVVESQNFIYESVRAQKFRQYTGLSVSDVVVTMFADLEQVEPCSTMIQGIRLSLNQLMPEIAKRVRVLLVGSGSALTEIKYQIADLGLGSRTMIIAQDPKPFLADLLAATDVLLEGRHFVKGQAELLPWHVLQAVSAGVQVVTVPGTLADDWLAGSMETRAEDFSPMDIGIALRQVLSRGQLDVGTRKSRGEAFAEAAHRSTEPVQVIQAAMNSVLSVDAGSKRRREVAEFVRSHQIPVTYRDASNVLVACEEVKEFATNCERSMHSEVLRIRGDALAALSRGDEALKSFEESLKADHKNYHALRGLGYLAWHGHSHDDAMSFFRKALAINQNDYQCLVGVGLIYRRLKMFDEAVFWLQKALSIGGLDSSSLGLIVQACLENPDSSQSAATLMLIRDTMGDHPSLNNAISKLESHF